MRNFNITALFIWAAFVVGCGNDQENIISESGIAEITDVSVSAETPGKLLKLFAEEGSLVDVGDTLATIEHEELDYQLMQAKANEEAAEAQLNLLLNGARKEDVYSIAQSQSQANANYRLAKRDLERIKKLFEEGSATQKQLDDASARFQIAESKLKQAKAAKKKIMNFARPEEIRRAEAALKAARAKVLLLEKKINDATILAPVSGVIDEYFYESGEFVPPYSVLCDILDQKLAKVEIFISETDLGKVKTGLEAKIYADSFPNQPVLGRVVKISDVAEFTPKTIQTKDERTKLVYRITIEAVNSENKIKGGMPVDVELEL